MGNSNSRGGGQTGTISLKTTAVELRSNWRTPLCIITGHAEVHEVQIQMGVSLPLNHKRTIFSSIKSRTFVRRNLLWKNDNISQNHRFTFRRSVTEKGALYFYTLFSKPTSVNRFISIGKLRYRQVLLTSPVSNNSNVAGIVFHPVVWIVFLALCTSSSP